jgi:hypothetical protein
VHVFVAGPGRDDQRFLPAVAALERAGYTAETGLYCLSDPWDPDWIHLTLETLRACDGVATLAVECRRSPGAMFEIGFAAGAGLPCMPLEWWLDRDRASDRHGDADSQA